VNKNHIKLKDLLVDLLVEQEQDPEAPEEQSPAVDPVDQLLSKFKILRPVLTDLLLPSGQNEPAKREDLKELVDTISVIAYKPTTFDIKFKNGEKMQLKYDLTAKQERDGVEKGAKAREFFKCKVLGKTFTLRNNTEYQDCLDYIGRAITNSPIGQTSNQTSNKEELPPLPGEEGGKEETEKNA
jgi:hypothetical protein